MMSDELVYILAHDQGGLTELAERISELGRAKGWSPRCMYQLSLALDELISNTLRYGYEHPGRHRIQVSLSIQGRRLHVVIQDNAIRFNPFSEAPAPELNTPLLERQRCIGGMGVHLVKKVMDRVEYAWEQGGNVVRLEKEMLSGCG
jgi:serine/threonine-protein kinase RsbW